MITESDYNSIIDGNNEIFFQPIINIKKNCMQGMEALFRAGKNISVSTEEIFKYAQKKGDSVFIYACMKKTLEYYKSIKTDRLLFINFESYILENYLSNPEIFIDLVNSLQIDHRHIVAEINEKEISNEKVLQDFTSFCRENNFLIALDDVGSGHSNLCRIAKVKPDIVKIDKELVAYIDQDYYKQSIVKCLAEMSSAIGALSLAEGTERKEEVLTCMDYGISLFQGWYFAKAMDKTILKTIDLSKSIHRISGTYKTNALKTLTKKKLQQQKYAETVGILKYHIDTEPPSQWKSVIKNFMIVYDDIECVYILDESGIQITDTFFLDDTTSADNPLYSKAKKNDSHEVKDYYITAVACKPELYVSNTYISLATGNFCKTYSLFMTARTNKSYIICVDFKCDSINPFSE